LETFIYANTIKYSMERKDKYIAQVWVNKSNGQKLITIPKSSDIESGDFVEITKKYLI
jgi:hypothetical protein